MMTAESRAAGYRIVGDDNSHGQRVIAVTADDIEICGSFKLARLNDWHLYVSKLVADTLDLTQPHNAHICSRDDAIRWVDILAALYMQAVRP